MAMRWLSLHATEDILLVTQVLMISDMHSMHSTLPSMPNPLFCRIIRSLIIGRYLSDSLRS
uniref:Ovule protein n=1 Tax=Ascaris lumbricoides TaxID=6252 RepID=A0A0M3HLV5_ASCLU